MIAIFAFFVLLEAVAIGFIVWAIEPIRAKCCICGKRSDDVYKGYHPHCWYKQFGTGKTIYEIHSTLRQQGLKNQEDD